MRIAAIINPISGAGADVERGTRRMAALTEQLDRRRLRATISITTHAGHARELAVAAVNDGADILVVWGGDGTVNEAGTALLLRRRGSPSQPSRAHSMARVTPSMPA